MGLDVDEDDIEVYFNDETNNNPNQEGGHVDPYLKIMQVVGRVDPY